METSRLFTKMGLGSVDMGVCILILAGCLLIAIVLLIVNMVKLSKMKKRLDKFLTGKNARNLEQEISGLFQENKLIKATTEKNTKDIKDLYRKLRSAYQKIGLVKYDAFQQMGGSLSFSLALLDERNDGFIMNSVHSTDGCYSYVKEIYGGKCKLDLGTEEQKALSIALGEAEEDD